MPPHIIGKYISAAFTASSRDTWILAPHLLEALKLKRLSLFHKSWIKSLPSLNAEVAHARDAWPHLCTPLFTQIVHSSDAPPTILLR